MFIVTGVTKGAVDRQHPFMSISISKKEKEDNSALESLV